MIPRVQGASRLDLHGLLFYGVNNAAGRRGFTNRLVVLGQYLWPLTYEDRPRWTDVFRAEWSRDVSNGVAGWFTDMAQGFLPTRVAVTEMVALIRSLALVGATSKYHYTQGDKNVAVAWLEQIRTSPDPMETLLATFPAHYDMLSSEARLWVSTERDNLFYRMYRAWGYKSCATTRARQVDTATVVRTFRANKLDWDKLADYVLDSDTMPVTEQEDIERRTCAVVYASGYLPPHLCREFGYPEEPPVTLTHYGLPGRVKRPRNKARRATGMT